MKGNSLLLAERWQLHKFIVCTKLCGRATRFTARWWDTRSDPCDRNPIWPIGARRCHRGLTILPHGSSWIRRELLAISPHGMDRSYDADADSGIQWDQTWDMFKIRSAYRKIDPFTRFRLFFFYKTITRKTASLRFLRKKPMMVLFSKNISD